MDENQNPSISSTPNIATVEHDIHPASDATRDHDNPHEFYDEYMYDELYYDSMCMMCQHWNGYMCNAENGNCNYEPI